MADDGNGTSIRYSTKELLQQLNDKLDRIDEKLDAKADKVVVDQLIRRVDDLDRDAVKRQGSFMQDYADQKAELRRVANAVDVNLPRFQDLQHSFKTSQATLALHNEWIKSHEAVQDEKTSAFTRNEKAVGVFFALVTLSLNFLALGPDLFH